MLLWPKDLNPARRAVVPAGRSQADLWRLGTST
jgi:hypothetical protein